MDYIAFALKYRPKNFDEVVGQEQVVVSLKNAILKKHIHHAYLFSGPRGTGKTSLARIIAKAFNCESSKDPVVKPCEKCISCVEIAKGISLDIIEIDGASNRSIEDIRTLRENVKLSSAHSRYKIYIIDEVHMLTQEAFNALLKTLEEPPAHVKFIFATTHPHKVLPTILSRCQKFQFNLVPLEKIVDKLKKIVKAEGISIEDSLLYAIARAAGGSIRDAESLLDQLVPVILEKGSIKDVLSFLGIIDEDTLTTILKYIVEKDLSASLDFIDKVVKDGKDLGIFLNALIEYLRNLLLAKVSTRTFKELIDISPQAKDSIFRISENIPTSEILEIIDLLIEAKELSHRLNTVRVPLEVALVKFSYQGDPVKIKSDNADNSIKKNSEQINNLPEKPKQNPETQNKTLNTDFDLDIDSLDVTKKESEDEDMDISQEENTENDNVLLSEVKAKWQETILHIQKVRAAIASHLSLAEPISSSGSVATIAFAKKNYFHKEIVESGKNVKFLEGVVSKIIGKNIGLKFTLVESVSAPLKDIPEAGAPSEASGNDSAGLSDSSNELINELLEGFGGRLHTDDE
ncbi:MAG: DNA polymerase III subunit gamma/tau [Candidatus Omnitrophota bacterium]|nr:DNA polymerase III subunit gamma/tau [Candidatus Omnitrophota bacterium]